MSALKLISKIFGKNKLEITEIEAADQKTGMSYEKMLERAYTELAIKKIADRVAKQRYIKTRSAELVKEIDCRDNGENISATIINLKIEFVKNEIDEYRKKIYNSDNKIGKEYHLPKKQKRTIEIRIANLEYNLKNLFKHRRDLFFYCCFVIF